MTDTASTLRGMAEGRIMLNVRHGIATPAGLLAKAADEIDTLTRQLAEAQRNLQFVAHWCWRAGVSAQDRVSAIKYHPAIKAIGEKPHTAALQTTEKP